MSIREGIQKLILEACCDACEMNDAQFDVDIDIVEPVVDMIVAAGDSYPEEHIGDQGRMFDYGHAKSDSHEGRMTKAKLFRMGKMAQSFHDKLEDDDDLPQWVNDKVTTAEDRLRSAYEYIDYKLHRMQKQGKMCNETIIRNMIRNYLV